MHNIKTIFFGTPEFACPALTKLIENNYKIECVVTQEDKKVGRKQIVTPSPIKLLAQKNNLKVIEAKNIKNINFINEIIAIKPDLIVVVAFGKIIPNDIIKIPKFGAINIHPSLLPKYRGPSPIQSALLNGEKETGITIMIIDKLMDHGPILNQEKIKILEEDNAETLHNKLSILGANLLIKTIPDYIYGKIIAKEQEHDKSTICKLLKREDGKINFNKNANEIINQIQAFTPWPGCFIIYNGKRLKIIKAIIQNIVKEKDEKIGELFSFDNKLFLKCKDGILQILNLQIEGKKVMSDKDFINGFLR